MRPIFQVKAAGLWQRGKYWLTAVLVSALAACFGGEGPIPAPGLLPTLSGLAPVVAYLGVPTTFAVTGKNLPLTASVSIADGNCQTPVNRTASDFTVVCTPGGLAGNQIITLRSDTVINGGWWIGMQTIAVSTSPSTPPTPLTVINLLVDSGVNAGECYAAGSDVLVSCISPTAIALNDKQDGMTGRDVTSADSTDGQVGLSYSKVGTYAVTDCVKDNITGLTWQGKSSALVALPGDARNLEARGLASATNATGLCGFADWRLPLRGELQSLVNYGSLDLYFSIDTNWFPDTRIGAYYSATQYAPNLRSVWLVDFTKGSVVPDGTASSGVYVRLVR